MAKTIIDGDGQPLAKGINWNNNQIKAVNTLYGLCMGILSDGEINDREILFLEVWLKDNRAFIGTFPLNVVTDRIEDIMRDGVISTEEREDLFSILNKLVGGIMDSGTAGGESTLLPVDAVESITFEERLFCFTGTFIRGQRSVCEKLVIEKGALIAKNVTAKLDYLVIGGLASRDWVASSHGRKIEKAISFKEKGHEIIILSEKDWAGFVYE